MDRSQQLISLAINMDVLTYKTYHWRVITNLHPEHHGPFI